MKRLYLVRDVQKREPYMLCGESGSVQLLARVAGERGWTVELVDPALRPEGADPAARGSGADFAAVPSCVLPAQVPDRSDLVVIAGNCRFDKEWVSALLEHVLEGGHIWFFAEGTHLAGPHELVMLMGAGLRRRLPYGEISVKAGDTPLAAGFEEADLWDEPYIFERSVFDDAQVIVSAGIGTGSYPLVWQRSWYLGKVTCIGTGLTGDQAKNRYECILCNLLDDASKEAQSMAEAQGMKEVQSMTEAQNMAEVQETAGIGTDGTEKEAVH